jgi:regulator of replication initiation timing
VPQRSSSNLPARVKASVTLDPDVLAGVKDFAGARGVSAFINEATRLHLENARLKELVAELIAEHGEPSAEARAAAAAMDVPW